MDRLGLVNKRLIAVHMTQLEDDEIATLAAKGGHVVHCPSSNLKLASGTRTSAVASARVFVCKWGGGWCWFGCGCSVYVPQRVLGVAACRVLPRGGPGEGRCQRRAGHGRSVQQQLAGPGGGDEAGCHPCEGCGEGRSCRACSPCTCVPMPRVCAVCAVCATVALLPQWTHG